MEINWFWLAVIAFIIFVSLAQIFSPVRPEQIKQINPFEEWRTFCWQACWKASWFIFGYTDRECYATCFLDNIGKCGGQFESETQEGSCPYGENVFEKLSLGKVGFLDKDNICIDNCQASFAGKNIVSSELYISGTCGHSCNCICFFEDGKYSWDGGCV